jgi:hypothetical protein
MVKMISATAANSLAVGRLLEFDNIVFEVAEMASHGDSFLRGPASSLLAEDPTEGLR